MIAVILAAGRGSRLGAITDNQPKCFTEVAGKRLLDYQIDALEKAGISQIYVVVGYQSDCFNEYQGRVTLVKNEDWHKGNMLISFLKALSVWRDQSFIVSYSDILYDMDAPRQLMSCPASFAISYDPNWLGLWRARFGDKLLEDAETFAIDSQFVVKEIGNRASRVDDIQGQYMGLLKFDMEGAQYLEKLLNSLSEKELAEWDMTRLLQRIMSDHSLIGVPYLGRWFEVDDPDDLAVAEAVMGGTKLSDLAD